MTNSAHDFSSATSEEVSMSRLQTALAISVAALIFAITAWAQGSVGTITGTVTDPSGATLSGATVTVTNTGTGATTKTTTSAAGLYRFVDLPPGMYSVTVEAPG